MLLEKGADVNAKDNDCNTALMKSSENGCTEIVAMLLEIVAKLVEKGADANEKMNDCNTALMVGRDNTCANIVSMLQTK